MKTIFSSLLLITIAGSSSGQVVQSSLVDNPAFKQAIAKHLRFPAAAQRQGQSVRVYVGFTLTKEGTCQNVSVINVGPIDNSLAQEVDRLWPMLPRQIPEYAGDYVVPIAFMLGEGGPERIKPIANQADGFRRQGTYTLLKEVSVTGWIACIKYALIPDSTVTVNLPIPK